jgi:putative membrane protein
VSPATYVARAGSIDLFEVKSGELALQRSSSARVRYFAQVMIAAHEGTGSQLSLAGRRLNLLPSAELLPDEQAMLDQLSATSDFDGTYLRQQRTIHQAALRLHQAFALRGNSPTLRPVAINAVAVERQHLDLLGRL